MAIEIKGLENEQRKIVDTLDNFSVLEYEKDPSVAPGNAIDQYYMGLMGVRKRHVVIKIDGGHAATVQAGAMQWMAGNVYSTTGIKGVGDMLGKLVKSTVTKESAIKPEYAGNGLLVLEPTFKYIILQQAASWGPKGLVVEDGMFLACDSRIEQKVVARSNLSSAALGKEGLFNLCLRGNGVVALESNIPAKEVIEINLTDDVLKVDGSYAICWSGSLEFSVERSSKTLLGSMVNSEGLVNVYRGTGKVWLSPTTASTGSLIATTHN